MSKGQNRQIEAIYPLSPMQQGMLFHSVLAPQAGMYFEQLTCTLIGPLDTPSFGRALQTVVDRHSALRTSFVWKRVERMMQAVHRHVGIPLTTIDCRSMSAEEQADRLRSYLEEDREKGFDLSKPPLLRFALLRMKEDVHRLVWSHHHLLLDGWSFPIVVQEVFATYEAVVRGQQPQFMPARPYGDYIAWLGRQDATRAEAFWRERLKGFSAPTPIPVERPDVKEEANGHSDARELVWLTRDLSAALQGCAQKSRVTFNTLLQAAWAQLLHRYSGESEVVFGATVSGRPADLPGAERMVGLFINTLPVRVRCDRPLSVTASLADLQRQEAEAREFQHASLVQMQSWSEIPHTLPLFRSIVVFENYPVGESLRPGGTLRAEDLQTHSRTNYPLTVISAAGPDIPLMIAYDTRHFDRGTIRRMLGHLQTLLAGMASMPEESPGRLPMLTEEESAQLGNWNETRSYYEERPLCIHQWFERIARATPEAIAVSDGVETLRYGELDRRANQLARLLLARGIGVESRVGLCLERSVPLVAGILGILKAGGCYVPLDPAYPRDRLEYMVHDAGLEILLTRSELVGRLPDLPCPAICLDERAGEIGAMEDAAPATGIVPENLAYIIYTSGSTGRPKGVMLQHLGLTNFVRAQISDWQLAPSTCSLQFASASFDASIAEIFGALCSGGRLAIAGQTTVMSPEELHAFLRREEVSHFCVPPSLLAQLSPENLPSVKSVVSAGEACPWDVALRWSKGRMFYNGYGPTESTVGATWQLVGAAEEGESLTAPIGRPIANLRAYLLDAQLRLVPVGVPGEIFLGGPGLARGYLNRPEVTAERFLPDIVSGSRGSRLYRTGDLARRLPDGRLEFVGRTDQQVKIRGFRIELGEIESRLLEHPAIREGAVVVREDDQGGHRLAAYFVLREETAPSLSDLHAFLKVRLPEYMVPEQFLRLESLPLTANGKIDRKSLAGLEGLRLGGEREHVPPRTLTEEILAGIWADILGLPRAGIHDDFFQLGGHSLRATQLLSRIRNAFSVELPLKLIFDAPTIAAIAEEIDRQRGQRQVAARSPIVPVSRNQELPLSFAQQRLWFLEQLDPGGASYTIPTAFRLSGDLDVNALRRSITEIVRRHEILRTTFRTVRGRAVQEIHPPAEVDLPLVDCTSVAEGDQEAEVRRRLHEESAGRFNLETGPLFRTTLLRLSPAEHVVLFTVHHIIADGWSTGVLVNELTALYGAYREGRPSPLPDLPVQYADYACWQRDVVLGEELKRQLDFWRKSLEGAPPVLELPTDHSRPARASLRGSTVRRRFSAAISERLSAVSRREGVTPFMGTLAAFQALLHRTTGQEDVLVGSPIANRTRLETEGLIGFFVNTLVVRARIRRDTTFRELLHQVREACLGAFAHQDLPFERLVEELQPVRDASHAPLFQVAFMLQNAPSAGLRLPGLRLTPLAVETGTAKYDLTLTMMEGAEGLECALEYCSDLFERATAERMLGHLETLLLHALSDPERQIGFLPIMPDGELRELLGTRNRTEVPYPDAACVHEVFEEAVRRNPQAIAATYGERTLTYDQLNRRANRLARHLRTRGIGPDDLVGIFMDRSLDLVVAMLGILKAGGAFVPLDPSYPQDRLTYMVQDAGLRLVLTESASAPKIPAGTAPCLRLDENGQAFDGEAEANLTAASGPDNLAYVIYTSGSTGRPKGTMLPHRGLCNLAAVQQRAFGIESGTRVLQFSALSFDASVWETVMALLNGATLTLTGRENLLTGQGIAQLLRQEQVTTVTLPPSVLAVMPEDPLPALRTIIVAGETCTGDLVRRWGSGRAFFNAYGPTETTVCASMFRCTPNGEAAVPIGTPIANFQLFIVDRNLQPQPVGIPGELLIGGVGLARGYLGRPDLTAEKFIPDPFTGTPGARIYRSGDLCRYRSDGTIEFLGRIDHQVKVRGFRIELGEVESVIDTHPAVAESAVVVRGDTPGDRRLAAYVVLKNGPGLQAGELRTYLKERLPEYMLPSVTVFMETFPLSPSGKVDRRALPAPDGSQRGVENAYVAPRNSMEEQLAMHCRELLGVERVGIYDNFFELGGHSLLATQFVSRVEESFHVHLPLRSLFERPTIAELGEEIQRARSEGSAGVGERIVKQDRGRATLEGLLQEIERMSPEEVQALLGQNGRTPGDATEGNA